MRLLILLAAVACKPGEKAGMTDSAVPDPTRSDTAEPAGGSDTSVATDTAACHFDGNPVASEPCVDCTFQDMGVGEGAWCGLDMLGQIQCWAGAGFVFDGATARGVFTSIVMQTQRACAIRRDGNVCCWGVEISDFDPLESDQPFAKVATESYHSCGILEDGAIVCAGHDSCGAVSEAPSGTFTDIAVGYLISCAIASDGSITCWGVDGADRDTYCDEQDIDQVDDTPEEGAFTSLWVGLYIPCALDASGAATCWGSAGDALQARLDGYRWTELSIAPASLCGLTVDQAIVCPYDAFTPPEYPTEGVWSKVAVGLGVACALDPEGKVQCWDDYGTALSPIYTTGTPGVLSSP